MLFVVLLAEDSEVDLLEVAHSDYLIIVNYAGKYLI